jgi:hypothetical protein
MEGGDAGINPDRPCDERNGVFVATLLPIQYAKQMQCMGMLGMMLEDVEVSSPRFLKLSLTMMRNCLVESV